MSAVFTGNGLGLFNTSLSQLGSGLGGSAGVGQGRDAQYVNAATGNLVWQSGDEHLVFRGLAIGLTRTYNSLGQVGDVGADGWLTGFERKVALQSGTFNASGSVMRRTTGDGSYQDFVWTAPNTYQSTGGDGAHDTLTWTGSSWRYVEGSTRREEGYASHADATALGRVTYLREGRSDGTTPVTWQVIYDANQRISELRADDGTSTGDALIFAYDGSGRLSSVSTRESGTVRLQVSYGYDGQGRLTSVLTDLTPGNTADNTWDATTASNNNGRLFRTEYTYVGTSLQLASVQQSDGTVVSYTYHADGRLKTVTRGDTNINDADGAGETLTYTYGTGTTTVTDSLNRAWVYAFDGNGQLTSLTAPAISGQSDITTYLYDASGNVTQAKTVRGATVLSLVDYAYDSAGNVTWEWDGLGNAISRTWSASNQLLTLTRYTGVDPDRAGAGLPTGGMTTRYIYDAQNRLRFVVDAADQVSEFTYATSGNGIGQQASLRQYLGAGFTGTYDLTSLQTWATATQKASSQLSELTYDTWGRLSQRTDYAAVNASGAGVLEDATAITRYTYDAQGTLRQQVTVRGTGRTVTGAAPTSSEQVDYNYDGMGRLLSVIQRQVGVADSDVTTVQTSYSYLDSGHQVQVTDDVGKVTVQTRDSAGRMISVNTQGVVNGSTQTRTQLNYYDGAGQLRATEDANGGRTYYFYDAKGRLAATVDATGAVSRITYDGADRILSTRQYANRVTTTDWIVGGEVAPTTVTTTDNNTLDRVTGRTYDAAGQLKTETDALASSTSRTITTYTYDAAGRVTKVVTTDSVGTTATARTVRSFYDAVGRLIGKLDAAGYLSEIQYDRAGRVLVQTRYATVSPSAYWATGTLAELKPGPNNDQDQTTRYYYDGRGQQVGVLDAEGYLTEWVFDEKGNTRAERRYATALTWSGSDTLATLRSRAGAAREQRMAYNALGQLATQINAEGTVTQYTYDEAGRLVKTEAAQGTSELREGHLRYNVFGELIGELGGESAPQVLPGMTEAQLDAVYAQYGVRHGYDVLGRRIESIDAAGNRTWYFYDAAGRNTFTVRGVIDSNGVANAQGEVTETRYTAFGDVSDQIAYTGRINVAVPGSRDSVQAAVSTLAYSSSIDTRRQFTYTARGQVATTTDAVNTQTRYTYDAFGQLQQQVQAYGNAAAVTTQYQYDVRGLQTSVTEAVGAGTAIERSRSQAYDAFGRVISATDARGAVRTFTYDRLGRQLTSTQNVQGRVEAATTSYDAYGRALSVTDAEGQVTTYVHDDATRSLTVTSPEGIVVTTIHNRHGQMVRVTDAAGATEYTFDRNGALTKTERKAGDGTVVTAETRQYDTARGLLTAVIDGSGRKVEYQYDATGRVLRRIQDPAGLALTTVYTYDGQGRQLTVTDPGGRVTGYSYDREGRLTQMAQDPASLNLRTQYTYDALGRQLTVVEGATTTAARTTQYIYDVLGRRTSEVVDPGAGKLNLTTSYTYDKNDNVIRRTDANGQVTRYYYDEANRQVYTIDPLGGMTRQWYDKVGQVVAVRNFSQPTNPATLTDADTISQLDLRIAWQVADQGEYRIYDKDGRVRFVWDTSGALTQHSYDAAGRMAATWAYADAYDASGFLSGLFAGTIEPAQIVPTPNDARDERTWYVRDAAGQVQLTVDALGNVRQLRYDASGRVVGSVAYAQAAALTAPLRAQLQAGTATVAGVLATVTANAAKDLVEHRVHDAAGRLRYTIDAIGAVHETLYDAAGLEVGSRAYAVPVGVDAGLQSRLQAGTATVTEVGALLTPAIVNDVRNQESYQVRDTAGRVRFTLQVMRDASGNPTGMLGEVRYDQAGRVTERLMRETPVTSANVNAQLAALRAGTASVSTVSGWMTGTTRYTAWVYDAAGRTRYTLQADTSTTRTVREQRFDATGQVVAEVAYAVTIPSGTSRTVTAVAAALTSAGGDAAAQQRVTLFVRDAAGRIRFQMDDAGAVSELRYDGIGRVIQSRQYGLAISTATAQTEAAMTAAVAGQSGVNVLITQTTYDAASRVASTIDAAGKTESYGYDAVGRRTSLTNKLGLVWTYSYDAAGRMTEEISPQVSVTSASVAGVVTTDTRSIKTVMTYDALGNVLSRTEDALGAQPRVTQYQYDSRGHQIKTIFPDAWQVDGNGQLAATGQTPSIEVAYDALGQAVVQKDVRGNYSYKVYNSLGQVAFEIDPEGHVSGYTYNAFGEQAQLTRYATRLNFAGIAGFTAGAGLSLSQMTASVVVANATNDRVLTTSYNVRGQKTQVTQSAITYVKADGTTASASPTTQFTYNAFGELTRTSVLLDASTSLWAHSWQYYDELGRVTLGVDAEGYVTQTQYNALGEVAQVREYAKALASTTQAALTTTAPPPPPAAGDASTGYDRVVSYTYDAMGRKASESVLRTYARADGSQGVRNVATQWTYDAAGQATVTDVDGQQTKTTYDALGRVSSVQEAAQQRLASTAESALLGSTGIGLGVQSLYVQVSAYTTLAYDAFGNAVRTVRYANGKVGDSAVVADAANDQVSLVAYDRQGRAVMNQDAEGNRVILQYDAADNIIHSWYALNAGSGANKTVHSYYTYDAAGRQLTSRTERSGEAAPDQLDVVQYNAFGEIVAKGNDLVTLPAQYQYDKSGNLIRSNAEGAWRDYGYNLAGHQVRESHTVYMAAGNSVAAVTRTTTDRLGRTVAMVLPSHTATATPVNYLAQKVDRWGNVIELVDPRGYQTTYQYNDRNQLVKEVRPLVEVVTAATPGGTWLRPELSWSYDELGRLVASRDGNGNTTRYEYDGSGKQTKVIDANGSVTLTAYDALGRERISQDALGYLTWKQYDRLDRVTTHGDYLNAATGGTRNKKTLESYVLNQNGQRVQVTNALSQAAKYDYDSRGLLVRSQTPTGVVMQYAYDVGGRRSLERYALAQSSVVDRDGETVKTNEQTWDYDYFGRLIDRNDLGGNDYNYTYDTNSGQLTGETNSLGLSRTTLYTANGLVRELQEPNGVVYKYEYDQAGNRTLEEAFVKDSRGKQYNVRTLIVYDSHNRIQRVTQDDLTTSKRMFELIYAYDAAGNRTKVVSRTGYGENTTPIGTVDAAPTVIGLPASRTLRSGVASQFRVRLTDLFRDPEGKALNVTAVQVSAGSETALPSWLSYVIDPNTGEAVFSASTGSSAANGQAVTLRLKANDGASVVSTSFDLNVRTNTAPVEKAGATTSYIVKTGRAWAQEFSASDYFLDEDVGDSLGLTATVSPSAPWMAIDSSNPSVLRLTGAMPEAGTYTVTLTATDQLGATSSRTITLIVAANTAPTVVAPVPSQTAIIGRSFLLERDLAAVFQDTHGDALALTATLADGNPLPSWLNFSHLQNQATPQIRLTGQVPSTIADGTVIQVKLTAMDPDGAISSTTFNVTIRQNQGPAVVAVPPQQEARIGQAYAWDVALASLFSDAEGDQLSIALVHPQGTAATGWLSVSVDDQTGVLQFRGTPTNTAYQNGTYTIRLVATDAGGLSAQMDIQIRLRGNNLPVLNPGVYLPEAIGASLGRNFSYTIPADLFIDVDGDPIQYVVTGYIPEGPPGPFDEPGTPEQFIALPSWLSYNAATRTLSGVVPSSMGAAYTAISIRALAGPQYSDIRRMIRVEYVPNSAPVLVTPLANQNVARNHGFSYTVPIGTFGDAEGDSLTYTASGMPPGVSFDPVARTFSGTPTTLGATTITLTAHDGFGGARGATFTLNVYNIGPSYAGGLQNRLANAGTAVSWNLPAGAFSDPNGDALSYTVMVERPGYMEEYLGPFNEPQQRWHDPEWMTVNWLTANPSSGTVTGNAYVLSLPGEAGIHADGIARDYRVKVIASDGLSSAEGTFNLTINTHPQAVSVSAKVIKQGASVGIALPAFTDNGSLTYSLSGLPSGLNFDPSSRVISGVTSAVGTFTVTYSAVDAGGLSASTTFTITSQANNAPSAPGVGNISITRGLAHDSTLPSFSDPDFDPLYISVTGLPPGMTASGAHIYGTPTVSGTYTVSYSAHDGRGGTASTTFLIIVSDPVPVNQAPTLQNPLQDRFVMWNRNWSYTVPTNTFYDPNGDTLTYSASNMPGGMSFNPTTRTFSMYTPKSTLGFQYHNITVTVSDGRGGTASDSFSLYVEPWEVMMSAPDEQLFVQGQESGLEGQVQAMSTTVNIEDVSWYAYDKMNRVVVANGQLSGSQVVMRQGYDSYGMSYDAVGNAVAQQRWKYEGAGVWKMQTTQQVFSQRKQITLSFGDGYTTAQVYDEVGRLTERTSFFGTGTKYTWIDDEGNIVPVNVSGMLASYESSTYDADGRLLTQISRSRNQDTVLRTPVGYPAKPQQNLLVWVGQVHDGLLLGGLDQYADMAVLSQVGTVSYTGAGRGYDAAGRVVGYSYQSDAPGTSSDYTHTYAYTYEARDSYLEKTVTGSPVGNANYKVTTSTMTYDYAGRQTEIREHTEQAPGLDDRVRSFALDGQGMILSRRDGTVTGSNVFQQNQTGAALARMNLHNVYANGQQVAALDEAGKLDVQRRMTGFSNTDAGRTQVAVQAGETARILAHRIYGNGNLWYVIVDANALSVDADTALVAGESLTIPEVRTSSNDASTFKPYNPGEITGPTSPGLPYIPAPDQGCGTVGLIIMVAIAVVVAVYTAGAASGAMTVAAQTAGTSTAFASAATVTAAGYTTTTAAFLTTAGSVAAGAAAGAAGAAAGMAAGSLMDVASFNWSGVAAGAITGAITGGLAGRFGSVGEALEAGRYGQASALALGNAGATYAGQALAGANPSFSWRSIAASAVSSVVSAKVTPGVVEKMRVQGEFATDFAYGMTGGMVSAAVRSSFGQTLHRSDYWTVAADAFGNALANRIARDTLAARTKRKAAEASGVYDSEALTLLGTSAQPEQFYGAAGGPRSSTYAFVSSDSAYSQLGGPMTDTREPSGGVIDGWDEAMLASQSMHAALYPTEYGNKVPAFDPSWSYEHKLDYFHLHRSVHDSLPTHSDNVWYSGERALAEATATQRVLAQIGGGILGATDFARDSVASTVELARNLTASGMYQWGIADRLGVREAALAYHDQLGRTVDGVVQLASWQGAKQVVGSYANRYAQAHVLAARGDAQSLMEAARIRTGTTLEIGATAVGLATGGYGAVRLTVNGARIAGNLASGVRTVLTSAMDGPMMGTWRPQIGAVGDVSRLRLNAAEQWGDVAQSGAIEVNPLPELRPGIRSTFLDGEAVVAVLDEPLLVQRFHGRGSSTKGSFATPDIFKSRVDARERLALPYTWSDGAAGNAVTKVTTIELPAGTRIWSGKAAPQIDGISGKVYQGGGNQIWIDAQIQDDWIKDTRWFRSDRGKN